MLTLTYDQGTLLLADDAASPIPAGLLSTNWKWDERIQKWRSHAIAYRDLIAFLHRSKVPIEDKARRYVNLELHHQTRQQPHAHQKEALDAWRLASRRGVVVLPTGSGKTYLAELAIQDAARSALILAPTIDLLNQWYDGLSAAFGCPIGLIGGGYHEVHDITVTTYDSAWLYLDKLGDRFGLLVFDECHHLPGPTFAQSAEWAIAPFRLGLTATLERPDGGHQVLDRLIGPVVYRRDIKDLAGEILADYQVERLVVDLSSEEAERYAEARATYRAFVWDNNIAMSSPQGFQRFIMLAARSDEGRAALKAYRMSRQIALAAPAKMQLLESLLVRHRRDRVIIFTHENAMAFELSRRFFIPTITHHTDTKERKEILENFREGVWPAIATSKVLNEGINIPSANVGIVLSGSASVREHVQRLGRLLRRHQDKEAILYEIVTRGTLEENVSERRREHSAYR